MTDAEEAGASVATGHLADQIYAAFAQDGHAGRDFSSIIKTL